MVKHTQTSVDHFVKLALKGLTMAAIGANADATGADSATFKITDAKHYVPIVTLSAEGNLKLNEGFKCLFIGKSLK